MKYITSGSFAAMIMSSIAFLTSCADDLKVGGNIDESAYSGIYENNAYLHDGKSNLVSEVVELHDETYATTVEMRLSKTPNTATSTKVKIDAAYLEACNRVYNTDLALYPQDLATFANEGVLTVNANTKSAGVEMTIRAGEDLQEGRTYAIPVTISDQSSDITVKDKDTKRRIYLVKDMRDAGDAYRGESVMQGYLFFEMSDVNPLNTPSFQLENERLFQSVVVLFTANINYDVETGRPRVQCNPNIQYLLDSNETPLQPLRRRGVRVLLGLLGSHDITGLTQPSKQDAKDFVRKVAQYCKTYNLDGVNYDGEYSDSPDLGNPSLANPSMAAAAHLCCKTKQTMPDKLVTAFDWGQVYGMTTIDGVDAKEQVDIVIANYGSAAYPIGQMTKKQYSGISMEFSLGGGGSLSASKAQSMIDGGCGWFMGFAPNPAKYGSAFSRLQGSDEVLYGSNVATPTIFYKKNDLTPYKYPDDL